MNSTTVSYNISQPSTDDSISVYNTTSQDTTTPSFQSTQQTTATAVTPTNGSTAQSNSPYSTLSNVTPRSIPNNALVSNVMVNASTVATPAMALNVSTTINSTARSTSSTRASSSTTRVTATTGTQPRSSRVSMPPLNPVTVNTGFSKGPVIIPASGTTINNVKIDCGAPPSIEGATTVSSGPYRSGMSVVYTCLSGYTMTGAASLLCGTDLKWSQPGPQCIGPSGSSGAEAHTGLERELAGMPVWMAIIVAMAVGVVCLILLACLLIMCMRIFGCWKGSFIEGSPRQSSQVYPEKTPIGVTRATSAMIVNEKRMKDPSTLQVDDRVFVRDNHFHDNGQPPQSHRLHPRPVHINAYHGNGTKMHNGQTKKTSQMAQPLINIQYDIPNTRPDIQNTRRQAKMPEGRQWMPHSHGVRNFNTSTK